MSWVRCASSDGRTYYANTETQATQWEAPPGFEEWWELWDASRGVSYFYCATTGAKSWTRPDGHAVQRVPGFPATADGEANPPDARPQPKTRPRPKPRPKAAPRPRVASDAHSIAAVMEKRNRVTGNRAASMAIRPTPGKRPGVVGAFSMTEGGTDPAASGEDAGGSAAAGPSTLQLPPPPAQGMRRSKSTELPAGWRVAFDASSNKQYYINEATSESQWTFPTVPATTDLASPPDIDQDDLFNNSGTLSPPLPPAPEDDGPAVALPSTSTSAPVAAGGDAIDPALLGPRYLPEDVREEILKFRFEDYAESFFLTQKRGKIFKRQIPVDEMLQFSPDQLPGPLLNLPTKQLKKEALQNFKLVQMYMGDQSSSKDPLDIASGIIRNGIIHPELRDEIYCQLVKQTRSNPDMDSRERGWQLFSCCVVCFPPTKGLENYLANYFNNGLTLQRGDTREKEMMAGYCLRKVMKIGKVGPRQRVPTAAELRSILDQPFNPSLFGSTIQEIMLRELEEDPNAMAPRGIQVLVDKILELNGPETVGIFRIPGDADQIQQVRALLNAGDYNIPDSVMDPNVPAGVLKLWMRELDEPLIPAELYDECKAATSKKKMLKVIKKLDEINRRCIKFLINFLQIIGDHSEVTKMGPDNIAMVFAPNFLRCPSENPQIIFDSVKGEQEFVRQMLLGLKRS